MSLLSARDLRLQYGKTLVQEQISFDIEPGVIFAVMGGSGCGKSTLLKSLIGLLRPSAGQVLYTQQDYWASNEAMRNHLRADIGVLFQSAALWSSMSVLDNVMFLAPFQRQLADALAVPVAISSLLQVPWVDALLPAGRRSGVITARASALSPALLQSAGAPPDTPVAGMPPSRPSSC